MGKLQQAESTYKQAIALRPHDWATYNWLGAFYYNQATPRTDGSWQSVRAFFGSELGYLCAGWRKDLTGLRCRAYGPVPGELLFRP
jgi:lipoprotein NlpI